MNLYKLLNLIQWSERSTFTAVVLVTIHVQYFLTADRHQATQNALLTNILHGSASQLLTF